MITLILYYNDPAAGSPTAALLRLLNPLINLVRANSTLSRNQASPKNSPN